MRGMDESARTLEWDIADRLRKALRVADLGVAEMADYLGVSRNTVGRYINGHGIPDRRTLMLWALRCGVPYEWLAEGQPAQAAGGYRDLADGDFGPPLLSEPDIPSGIAGYANLDHTELVRDFRKRLARIDATRIEEAAA